MNFSGHDKKQIYIYMKNVDPTNYQQLADNRIMYGNAIWHRLRLLIYLLIHFCYSMSEHCYMRY